MSVPVINLLTELLTVLKRIEVKLNDRKCSGQKEENNSKNGESINKPKIPKKRKGKKTTKDERASKTL